MVVIEGKITKQRILSEGFALTIGNFDGVHRGHVFLINQLQNMAADRGLKTGVLTFDPHPEQVFSGDKFSILTDKLQKIDLISQLKVDYLFIQDFNSKFSDLNREDFLRQYLMKELGPKLLLFGYDFRYGKKGEGDYPFAKETLRGSSIEIAQAAPFQLGTEIVSSSLIRQKLQETKINEANHLLGYSYKIQGQVVASRGLGRQIGFPTANLGNAKVLVPGQGVYAGWAQVGGRSYPAVLNVGHRPTTEKTQVLHVECHILDFSESIYGQKLQFTFVKKLRGEIKFASVEDLKQQIQTDIETARTLL